MYFAWNHSLLIRRVQALHGIRLPAQQQPLWEEDNSDLWKYLDSLTRILVHNLPPQSAILPPKLNHGACVCLDFTLLPSLLLLISAGRRPLPSQSQSCIGGSQTAVADHAHTSTWQIQSVCYESSIQALGPPSFTQPPRQNEADQIVRPFCCIVVRLVIWSLKTRTNCHIGTWYVAELCRWACAFLLAVTTRNHGAESGEQVPAWTKDREWFIWWHLSW